MDSDKGKRIIERALKNAVKKQSRKRAFWVALLCLAISAAASFVIHYIPVWYQSYVTYNDPFYRPMDIERQYHSLEQRRQTSTQGK